MTAIEGFAKVEYALRYRTECAWQRDLGEHVELVPIFPEVTESLCGSFFL